MVTSNTRDSEEELDLHALYVEMRGKEVLYLKEEEEEEEGHGFTQKPLKRLVLIKH